MNNALGLQFPMELDLHWRGKGNENSTETERGKKVQRFVLVTKILFNSYNNPMFPVFMNPLKDVHMRITTND